MAGNKGSGFDTSWLLAIFPFSLIQYRKIRLQLKKRVPKMASTVYEREMRVAVRRQTSLAAVVGTKHNQVLIALFTVSFPPLHYNVIQRVCETIYGLKLQK